MPIPSNDQAPSQAGESKVSIMAIVLLLAVAILAGTSVYTILELGEFREEVASQFATHEERLSLLDGSVLRTSEDLNTRVAQVKSLVEETAETAEQQIEARTRQVESRVLDRTATLEQEIVNTREASEARIDEVGGQLAATTSELGALGGEVDTVKEEVEEAKTKIEETIAQLTSVKGDLGVQSGLIATNGEQLEALKALGERNYYEFNLRRTNKAQRVGPVSIRVTGTDRKRNRYSIELWADDNKIVKRRKTLLEPVQFYVEGARIPYELVVNKIESNVIQGYLATPKTGPRGA